MVRGGWSRRFGMAAMGVAAALVLAVGGVGTARVATDLLSGSGDDGSALLSCSEPAGAPGPPGSPGADSFGGLRNVDDQAEEWLSVGLSLPAAPRPQGADTSEVRACRWSTPKA